MVDERAQVFITAFSPERLSACTLFSSLALTAGPFLVDLDIYFPLRLTIILSEGLRLRVL
jgi:hypothetical protein